MMSESTSFPTETDLGALLSSYAESPSRGPADPNLLLEGEGQGQRTFVSSIASPGALPPA